MAWLRAITRTAAAAGYWGTQSYFSDTIVTEQAESNLGCVRCTFHYSRTVPTGRRDDLMQFGISIAKIAGGGIYTAPVSADMIAAETALSAFATSLALIINDQTTLVDFTWHEHRANHPPALHGGEKTGPAVRLTSKSTVGGVATSRMPDQVSSTVTFRTASRKHWGRIYVPGIAKNVIDSTTGRIQNSTVDALAGYGRTLVNALDTSSLQLGVWTYQHQAFLPITELEVDDVADIQRRRRAKQANRKTLYSS